MGFQDRDYNRGGNNGGNLLAKIFMGDFTIGHFAGIKIRVHSSLILLLAFRIVFEGINNWQNALTSSVILFFIILLHEFGHCFAARAVGGRGDDVLLWPLGGLAFISTPRRPWPSFVGTAGGPLVNVLIAIICAVSLRALSGSWIIGNPLAAFLPGSVVGGWADMTSTASYYLWWISSINMSLLLFNMLPIFPLDFGRILQTILWPKLGFYKATDITCIVGMVLAAIIFVMSLGSLFMMFLMASCGFYCYQTRMNLSAMADEVWEEERYSGSSSWGAAPARSMGMPRLRLMRGGGKAKPLDDRLTLRDLNPLGWWKRRQQRKQFEKLVGGDD